MVLIFINIVLECTQTMQSDHIWVTDCLWFVDDEILYIAGIASEPKVNVKIPFYAVFSFTADIWNIPT